MQQAFPPRSATHPAMSRRSLFFVASATLFTAALPFAARAQVAPSMVMAADEAYRKALADEITLIDIRTPEEWAETGVPEGAIAIDMTQQDHFVQSLVALRMANAQKPIAMICRTGNRSGYVIKALAQQGFPGLVDVAEGIAGGPRGTGWLPRGLPTYNGNSDEINARLEKVMP